MNNGSSPHPDEASEYIYTRSGLAADLGDLDPASIKLEDVVHHLSHINRFVGATPYPYSVAHHSIRVALYLQDVLDVTDPHTLHSALLHDAGEAYYGDIVSPLKRVLCRIHGTQLEEVLRSLDIIIDKALNIKHSNVIDGRVLLADQEMLKHELADFMKTGPYVNTRYLAIVVYWQPPTIRELFMSFATHLIAEKQKCDSPSYSYSPWRPPVVL